MAYNPAYYIEPLLSKSFWTLFTFSIFFFLSLSVAKRQAVLGETRASGVGGLLPHFHKTFMKEQKCLKIQGGMTTERMLEQKVKHWTKTIYDPTVPPSFTVSWRWFSPNCCFSFNLNFILLSFSPSQHFWSFIIPHTDSSLCPK